MSNSGGGKEGFPTCVWEGLDELKIHEFFLHVRMRDTGRYARKLRARWRRVDDTW